MLAVAARWLTDATRRALMQCVQRGLPRCTHPEFKQHVAACASVQHLRWRRYCELSPLLADYISSAALIIGHAGSGSIFETLHAGKPLIVVPNPLLMDNHQAELGDHLAAMQAVVCAAPDQLLSAVTGLDTSQLKPFPAKNACGITDSIDDFMGRHTAAG